MGRFYDQDNPMAYLEKREENTEKTVSDSRKEISNAHEAVDNRRQNMEIAYVKKAEVAKKKSTLTPTQKARIKVIKQQRRRQEMNERIAALGLTCILIGGIASSVITAVADKMEENAIVYSKISEFRKEVIEPNTFRTNSGDAYYYEYDDIADAVFADGKDSSVELYKAYSTLGKKYTEVLLEEKNYSSLESFVERHGYNSIGDWKKYSDEAILAEAVIDEKIAELNAMHDEYTGKNDSAFLSVRMNGGNK